MVLLNVYDGGVDLLFDLLQLLRKYRALQKEHQQLQSKASASTQIQNQPADKVNSAANLMKSASAILSQVSVGCVVAWLARSRPHECTLCCRFSYPTAPKQLLTQQKIPSSLNCEAWLQIISAWSAIGARDPLYAITHEIAFFASVRCYGHIQASCNIEVQRNRETFQGSKSGDYCFTGA